MQQKQTPAQTATFGEEALTPDGSIRRSIMPRTDDCGCVRAEVRHPKFWMLLGLIAKMSECFCALDHPQWRLQTSLFNFFAPSASLCYSNGMQNRENELSKVVRGASAGVNPERWVDDHGDCLYRYALLRVRNPEVAEDLVQETLFAAVRKHTNFRGSSSERSWLCGILKNKICDHFRKLAHEVSFTDLEFLKDEMSHKFIDQGWNHDLGPAEWKPNPEAALDRKEFWETFRSCLDKLPERVAAVFMLREMEEMDTTAVQNGFLDTHYLHNIYTIGTKYTFLAQSVHIPILVGSHYGKSQHWVGNSRYQVTSASITI